MDSYLVIKNVNLLVGAKTYRKDAVITEAMVGKDKINRYLARGYVKSIGVATDNPPADEQHNDDGNLPFYLTTDEFLDDEEVLALERKDLLQYATHIGVKFNPSIPTKRLQPLVIQFIEDALSVTDDSNDSDSDDENNKDGSGADELKDGENNANDND